MPTTPGCQPSPATTMAAALACGAQAPSAANRIRVSASRRSRFSRSSSRATSAARASSSVSSSSSAAAARCIRPAALMRGPSRNPSACSPTSAGSTDATSMSARRPGLRVRLIAATPSRTMRRFSSRSGTTSHTVASAARSRSSSASRRVAAGARAEALRELERHARGAELRARVVAQAGVHHGAVGKLGAGPVVVGDHHVHPGGARGGHLGDRGDPAVDGHEQVHPAGRQPLDRARREAVPVVEAARDLPGGLGAERAEGPDEDRRGADAVHVVVAVHRDSRAAPHVGQDQLAGGPEPGDRERIVPLARAQEAGGLVGVHEAAAGQHGRQRGRDPERPLQAQGGADLIGRALPPRRSRLHPPPFWVDPPTERETAAGESER